MTKHPEKIRCLGIETFLGKMPEKTPKDIQKRFDALAGLSYMLVQDSESQFLRYHSLACLSYYRLEVNTLLVLVFLVNFNIVESFQNSTKEPFQDTVDLVNKIVLIFFSLQIFDKQLPMCPEAPLINKYIE